MSDDERRQRGLQYFDEVYGGVVPVPPENFRGDFFHNTIDQLFSEVWSRDVLSIRERRLVLIGAIAAQGEVETLEIQMRAALHKGELTVAQLREIVLFLPYYIGYPKTSRILMMSHRVIADHEAKTKGDNT
jgi:4-carboxymuconolactone decarboxylase